MRLLREPHLGANDNARAGQGHAGLRGPQARQDDEAVLVERSGQGDVQAFAILVERHSAASYRIACRMLGNPAEAEDVVQECFTRLWTSAPDWLARGAGLAGWLRRVTMNLCFDRLRKTTLQVVEAFPELRDNARGADQRLVDMEASRAIDGAMAQLPVHYRSAIILNHYEGLPNAEAAHVMDMPLKAFESILHRARRQLRKILEMQGFEPGDFEVLA